MSSRNTCKSFESPPFPRTRTAPRWRMGAAGFGVVLLLSTTLLPSTVRAQTPLPRLPSPNTAPAPRASALQVFDLVDATARSATTTGVEGGYVPARPAPTTTSAPTSSPSPASDSVGDTQTNDAAVPVVDGASADAPDTDATNTKKPVASAFSKIRIGVEAAAMSSTLVPIPNGLEGKVGGFLEMPLFEVDLTSPFGLFVRGRVTGSYGQATQTYRPSWTPFSGKGGLAFKGERYQLGADISAGVRIGPVETMLDLGGRAGLDPGIARFVGPRAALQIRAQLIESVSIHTFVEVQQVVSLGDTALGWTASSTGAGVGISYQF